MKLECTNGILFVGSCKNNLWHLHIEKNKVWILLPYHRDGFLAVTAFAHNFDIAIVLQHSTDKFARERFVVSDQGSDLRALHFVPVNSTIDVTSERNFHCHG